MVPQVLVLGGDSAGDFHARTLVRALGTKAVRVVTSHWLEAIREWIPRAEPGDQLVPAPMMPHLLWRWLGEEIGAVPASAPRGWGLPFEVPGPEGELYLSAAAWRCPATCIEPAHCPILHGPRDWDLAQIIDGRARELGFEPAVFAVRTYTAGIGSVPAASLQAAREITACRILVATTSHCHAAVGALVRSDAVKLSTRQ
ncbi:MAG: hypothetical protein M3Z13_00470 [Candidatus Dormibacteraeota bacterium]|nr:hypothetical protein [Candidatus Dormibacteraeota bacterium]